MLQRQVIEPSGNSRKRRLDLLLDFMFDRLRGLLKDAGHAQDVVEAVLAQAPTRIDLVPAKLDAVRAFLALPEALALAAANTASPASAVATS